mgnify:CR=1 FL=1
MCMKKVVESIVLDTRWLQFFIFTSLAIITMGCTSHRAMKTYEYLATAQVAINEARYAGADTIAPDMFNEAEVLLITAKNELNRDDFERARRSAQEAKTLAELATIKASAIDSTQDYNQCDTEGRHCESAIWEIIYPLA